MPMKPKRPCSFPGCPNLTDRRFCPEHEKLEAQRYERYDRDPATKRRYGRAWKRIREKSRAVTEFGFLAKHPTTGSAIQSPYVAMSQNFMSQTNRLWMEIYQIVKENCATEYTGVTPIDDTMERLLRARKGS